MASPSRRLPSRKIGILLALFCLLLVAAGCAGSKHSTIDSNFVEASRYVYVTNEASDTVAMFASNNKTHRLTYFGVAPTGHSPRGAAVGRNEGTSFTFEGRLVVANSGSDTLSVYRIFPTGNLELLSTVPTDSRPIAVSIPDPDSEIGPVNVLCAGARELIEYRFTEDSLAEVSRIPTGSDPTNVVSGPAGVLVPDGASHNVYVFYESDSGLSLVIPSTVSVGARPGDIVGFPNQFAKGVPGAFVFNAGDSSLSVFRGSTSDSTLLSGYALASTVKIDPGCSHIANGVPTGFSSISLVQRLFAANDQSHLVQAYRVQGAAVTKLSGTMPTTGSGTTNDLKAIGGTYGILLATNTAGSLRNYYIDPEENNSTLKLTETLDTHGSNPYAIASTNIDLMPYQDQPLSFQGSARGGTVGQAYTADFDVRFGRAGPKPSVTVSSGALPPGLSLTATSVSFLPPTSYSTTFELKGTPTAEGTYSFDLTVNLNGIASTRSFTVTVGGSSGGGGGTTGPSARFFNLDTRTGHDALSLKVSGSTFPVTAFGAASAAESIVPAGQTTFSLFDAGGAQVETGDTFLGTTGTRFYLIANVTGFAAGQIPPGEPAAGRSEIVVQGGANILTTQNVDVLDGANVSVAHDSYSAAGSVRLQVSPGTYTVRITNASTGATIATTAAFSVAANRTELVGTTSDSVGGNPQALAFAYD